MDFRQNELDDLINRALPKMQEGGQTPTTPTNSPDRNTVDVNLDKLLQKANVQGLSTKQAGEYAGAFVDSGFGQYDNSLRQAGNTLLQGQNQQSSLAANQSWAGNLGRSALKIALKIPLKAAQGIVLAENFAMEGVDSMMSDRDMDMDAVTNGGLMKLTEEWNKALDEGILQVNKSAGYEDNNIFQNLGTNFSEWLGNEGADMLAFAGSSFIPGLAAAKLLKGAQLGKALAASANLAKVENLLGTAGRLSSATSQFFNRLPQTAMIAYNTLTEPLFEANDVHDSMYEKLMQEKDEYGDFKYTEAQAKQLANEASMNTFLYNIPAVLLPNIMESRLLFSTIKGSRALNPLLREVEGRIYRKTVRDFLGDFARQLPKSFVAEGGQELAQLGISKTMEQLAGQEISPYSLQMFQSVLGNVVNNVGTKEGMEAWASGGILGLLFGGGQTYSNIRRGQRMAPQLGQVIEQLNASPAVSMSNIYRTKPVTVETTGPDGSPLSQESEELDLDEEGKPQIDPVKVAKKIEQNSRLQQVYALNQQALEKGDPALKQLASDMGLSTVALDYFNQGAEETLRAKILAYKKMTPADFAAEGIFSETDRKALLEGVDGQLAKLDKLSTLYNRIQNIYQGKPVPGTKAETYNTDAIYNEAAAQYLVGENRNQAKATLENILSTLPAEASFPLTMARGMDTITPTDLANGFVVAGRSINPNVIQSSADFLDTNNLTSEQEEEINQALSNYRELSKAFVESKDRYKKLLSGEMRVASLADRLEQALNQAEQALVENEAEEAARKQQEEQAAASVQNTAIPSQSNATQELSAPDVVNGGVGTQQNQSLGFTPTQPTSTPTQSNSTYNTEKVSVNLANQLSALGYRTVEGESDGDGNIVDREYFVFDSDPEVKLPLDSFDAFQSAIRNRSKRIDGIHSGAPQENTWKALRVSILGQRSSQYMRDNFDRIKELMRGQVMNTLDYVSENQQTSESENVTSPDTTITPTTDNTIEIDDIESRRQQVTAKIKRKDLFADGGVFANVLGGSGVDSVPTRHTEINGIEFVEFSNPNSGTVDVIMTGTSDNDFVGYYRIYDNGKPTNRWSSKFENQSRNKENFKIMMSGVQSMLPKGHEYTEKTSISTDGLRIWGQQLERGYELQYDRNGNMVTNQVAINGDAINNELGINVSPGEFQNISVKNKADFERVKKALLPYLNKLGLNESNIYWENGTVEIDLPVLRQNQVNQQRNINQTESTNEEITQTTQEAESAAQGNTEASTTPVAEPTSQETPQTDNDGSLSGSGTTIPANREGNNGRPASSGQALTEAQQQDNALIGLVADYNNLNSKQKGEKKGSALLTRINQLARQVAAQVGQSGGKLTLTRDGKALKRVNPLTPTSSVANFRPFDQRDVAAQPVIQRAMDAAEDNPSVFFGLGLNMAARDITGAVKDFNEGRNTMRVDALMNVVEEAVRTGIFRYTERGGTETVTYDIPVEEYFALREQAITEIDADSVTERIEDVLKNNIFTLEQILAVATSDNPRDLNRFESTFYEDLTDEELPGFLATLAQLVNEQNQFAESLGQTNQPGTQGSPVSNASQAEVSQTAQSGSELAGSAGSGVSDPVKSPDVAASLRAISLSRLFIPKSINRAAIEELIKTTPVDQINDLLIVKVQTFADKANNYQSVDKKGRIPIYLSSQGNGSKQNRVLSLYAGDVFLGNLRPPVFYDAPLGNELSLEQVKTRLAQYGDANKLLPDSELDSLRQMNVEYQQLFDKVQSIGQLAGKEAGIRLNASNGQFVKDAPTPLSELSNLQLLGEPFFFRRQFDKKARRFFVSNTYASDAQIAELERLGLTTDKLQQMTVDVFYKEGFRNFFTLSITPNGQARVVPLRLAGAKPYAETLEAELSNDITAGANLKIDYGKVISSQGVADTAQSGTNAGSGAVASAPSQPAPTLSPASTTGGSGTNNGGVEPTPPTADAETLIAERDAELARLEKLNSDGRLGNAEYRALKTRTERLYNEKLAAATVATPASTVPVDGATIGPSAQVIETDFLDVKPNEKLRFAQGIGYEPVIIVASPEAIELISIGAKRQKKMQTGDAKILIDTARERQLEKQLGIGSVELNQYAREAAKQYRKRDRDVVVRISVGNQTVVPQQRFSPLGAVSREAVQVTMKNLSEKFGIAAELITPRQAKNILGTSVLPKGFYKDGKVYLVDGLLSEDTPFHEFAHPFVSAIEKSNPVLYRNLLTEIQSETELVEQVKEQYPELSPNEQLQEAIVQALGQRAAIAARNQTSKSANDSRNRLLALMDRFLDVMGNLLQQIMGRMTKPASINENTTLSDLASYLINKTSIKLLADDDTRIAFQKATPADVAEQQTQMEQEIQDAVDPGLKKAVAQQIAQLVARKQELSRQSGGTQENRLKTAARIKTIDSAVARLQKETTYDALFGVAGKQLYTAENIFKQDTISATDLNDVLRILQSVVDYDSFLSDTLLNKEEKRRKDSQAIRRSKLTNQFKDAIIGVALKESRRQGYEFTADEITEAYRDVDTVSQVALSIEENQIPIVKVIGSLLKSADRKTQAEYKQYEKEEAAIREKYKKADFARLMDEGRLITAYTTDYFAQEDEQVARHLETINQDGTTTGQMADSYNQLFDWYKQNHTYQWTAEGKTLFEEDRAAIEQMLTKDGVLDADAYQDWLSLNSPDFVGQENAAGGFDITVGAIASLDEKGELINRKWYRYLKATPVAKWKNAKYETVKNDELYEFITNAYVDALRRVPHKTILDVGGFDKVLNGLVFDVTKNSFTLKRTFAGVKDLLADSLTVAIRQADITGESAGTIDEKGRLKKLGYVPSVERLQEEKQFDNPLDLLKQFVKLSIAYQHKVETEPILNLLEYQLANTPALQTTLTGQVIKNATTGEPQTVASGLQNSLAQVRYAREAILEGATRSDASEVSLSEKEREALLAGKVQQIRKVTAPKVVDAMVDFSRMVSLGLKPFSAVANLVMGISSNYLWASRGEGDFTEDQLNKAANTFFPSMAYFALGAMPSVRAKMEQTYPDIAKNTRKIAALANKYKITETLREGQQEQTTTEKFAEQASQFLYSLQTGGEYAIGTQIMLAMMYNTPVQNKKGETKNLFDAYNENGEWNTEEFGEQPDWTQLENLDASGLNTSKDKAFRDRLDLVRKRTQGDYQNPLLGKSKWYGRVLFMFRTWLPMAIRERFGKATSDQTFKGRYRSYRDIYRGLDGWDKRAKILGLAVLQTGAGTVYNVRNNVRFAASLIPGLNKTALASLQLGNLDRTSQQLLEDYMRENGISDIDIQNMRANLKELQFMLYSTLITLGLKALDGDDDDKELAFAINLAQRTYDDLSAFYDPGTYTQLVKKPVPMLRTVDDAVDVLDSGITLIENPQRDIYKNGVRRGDSKFIKELYDLIPVASAIQSTETVMSQVYGEDSKTRGD